LEKFQKTSEGGGGKIFRLILNTAFSSDRQRRRNKRSQYQLSELAKRKTQLIDNKFYGVYTMLTVVFIQMI